MKRVVLALGLALTVAAVPAVAQTYGNTSTGSTTTTGTDTGSSVKPGHDTGTGASALQGSTTAHEPLSGSATLSGANSGAAKNTAATSTTGSTTTTTGSSSLQQGTTTTTGSSGVQETRTNPDTASLAPGGGLTLSGTVVSWNDQEIVVRTTTGIEHVVIQPSTQRPSSFSEGQAVSIDYNRTSQNGVMIAERIRPGGVDTATTTVGETRLEQNLENAADDVDDAADEVGENLSQIDDEIEEEIEEETGSNLDNDNTIGDSATADMDDDTADTTTALPATAGKSTLVALLGLVALGAAAGLRRLF